MSVAGRVAKSRRYTVREAAALLDVTDQTVYRYLRNGSLSGSKMGPRGQWYVLGNEIAKKLREWGYR